MCVSEYRQILLAVSFTQIGTTLGLKKISFLICFDLIVNAITTLKLSLLEHNHTNTTTITIELVFEN